MHPRPNLPFDKKKAGGAGDASAITRMRKATAETADYRSKIGLPNRMLGSSSKSGFTWSLFQQGLVYQHNLLNVPYAEEVIPSATEPILSVNTIRVYWTTARPIDVVVDFYESNMPSLAIFQTKIGSVQVNSGITIAELSLSPTLNKFYKAIITPIELRTAAYTTPDVQYTGSYDVFVIMGQSNAVGFGGQSVYIPTTGTNDEYLDIDRYSTPGIKQWRRYNNDDTLYTSATATSFIVDARDQLDHNHDFTATAYLQPSDARSISNTVDTSSGTVSIRRARMVGFGYSFAKEYKAYTGRDVLLVPCARGGTSTTQWTKGNAAGLYQDALDRTIAAVTSVSGNKLCGVLWHQGESDVAVISGFTDRLQAIITSFRTDLVANGISGNKTLSTNVPWLIGELVPAYQDDNSIRVSEGTSAQKIALNTALKGVADTFTNTVWVAARAISGGYDPDDTQVLGPVSASNSQGIVHFNASSQRIFGKRYFNQYIDKFYTKAYIGNMSNFTAYDISEYGATFRWVEYVGENTFKYSYWLESSTNGTTFSSISTNATNPQIVFSLSPSTSYTIRLSAYNSGTLIKSLTTEITTKNLIKASDLTLRTFVTDKTVIDKSPAGRTITLNRNMTTTTIPPANPENIQVSPRLIYTPNANGFASLSGDFDAGSFTKSVWVNYKDLSVPDNSKFGHLLSGTLNAVPQTTLNHYLWLYNPTTPLILSAGVGTGSIYTGADSGVVATQGIWIHVACTFNNTNRAMKIYINGVLKNTFTGATFNTGHLASAGRTVDSLFIGSYVANSASQIDGVPNRFHGHLDDVRLYKVLLTDAEILSIYNRTG
jgi:hypothetical protein